MPNEETRQRLISEARLAFLSEGYGAASLDRIASAARISKKTIYKYVASKAELFVAVVEDAIRPIPISGLVAAVDDEDPEIFLRRFLLAVADIALSDDGLRFHWMIIREAGSFPELIPAFGQVIGEFLQALTFWIEAQRRRGRLRIESSEQAVSTLLTLLLEETRRGHALGTRPAPSAEEQARMVDRTIDLFLHGTLIAPSAQKQL